MRTKLFPITLTLAAALVGLTGCDANWGDFQRFTSDFHNSYPLKAGARLTVETFNGSVEVLGWDQETVDITGTKYGPTQDAADNLKVDIDHAPDSVSIRVIRPSERLRNQGARLVIRLPRSAAVERITSSNGSIRIQDGAGPSRLRTSNGAVHIQDFKGKVDIQTSNGSVELINVEGDAVARTSNGRIRTEGQHGSLDATTSNGSVNARLDRADRPVRVNTSNGAVELSLPSDYSSDVRVETSNGSITLRLPDDTNAHVMARTSNSSISSDFQMKVQGEVSKNRMDGVIGSGGPLIDLSTSNGSVRLVRL